MALDQDIYYLEEWADVHIESYPKSGKIPENPPGDSNVQSVFRKAENIQLKLSKTSGYQLLSSPGMNDRSSGQQEPTHSFC
ncbi:MAG: hypothetical protein PHV35_02355 [Mariniphaga sp.]|nr:hypothetical protein [Mariniphaga sp.]